MKLWEMIEPASDITMTLEGKLSKMDISRALTETAIRHKITTREVIEAVKIKALNEISENDPRRLKLIKRK
jgi:hypothetical protein